MQSTRRRWRPHCPLQPQRGPRLPQEHGEDDRRTRRAQEHELRHAVVRDEPLSRGVVDREEEHAREKQEDAGGIRTGGGDPMMLPPRFGPVAAASRPPRTRSAPPDSRSANDSAQGAHRSEAAASAEIAHLFPPATGRESQHRHDSVFDHVRQAGWY